MKFLIPLLSFFLFLGSASAETLKLNTKNTAVYRAGVDGGSVSDMQYKFQKLVMERGTKDYPIYLVMDCPGGSIYAGEQFIQFAKLIPNLHTVSIFAASMCSAIVEALPGKRYVTENGILMFHRAKGQFSGQFEEGEVESQLKLWKEIVRDMEQRNADRIGITLPTYKAKVLNEWWVYGKSNITEGTADALVDLECSPKLVDTVETIKVETMFGILEYDVSACPLFR